MLWPSTYPMPRLAPREGDSAERTFSTTASPRSRTRGRPGFMSNSAACHRFGASSSFSTSLSFVRSFQRAWHPQRSHYMNRLKQLAGPAPARLSRAEAVAPPRAKPDQHLFADLGPRHRLPCWKRRGCQGLCRPRRLHQDVVGTGKIITRNAAQDLGIPLAQVESGLMRNYVERRMWLGEQRQLTHMAQFRAVGR